MQSADASLGDSQERTIRATVRPVVKYEYSVNLLAANDIRSYRHLLGLVWTQSVHQGAPELSVSFLLWCQQLQWDH